MSGQNDEGIKKFKFEGEISQDLVKNFIQEWKDGTLAPYKRIETLAPAAGESPFVKKLNSEIFWNVVNDTTKDVLVMFVKPGCPLC